MQVKVGCISLGCPKNLVDSEIMLGLLNSDNYEITVNLPEAEVIIVNTCAFIGDAKEEAVDAILEASLYKQTGRLKALIVTGCLAQRYRDEIINEIPEVDAVLGTGNISEIERVIANHIGGRKDQHLFVNDPADVDYLDNLRLLSSKGASQYLKIAEGCSNYCTYCIIPSLRGPFRSRTVESILKEAKQLVENGARELILIAQDVSRYGEDRYSEPSLVKLIQELSQLEDLKWIRLLYCYPERITEALIQQMKSNPKLLPYLDIPIQHASDRILKAMGRKSRKKDLIALMNTLRKEIPGIVLRTSLITGFPGETEEDFDALVSFVRTHPFDRLGVFAYSQEEGTPAATMENQVEEEIRENRRELLLSVQSEIAEKRMKKRIGQIFEVLTEGVADDGIFYYGRSYGEAPDIDPLIYFTSPRPLQAGSFVKVRMLNSQQLDLIGEAIVNESAE
ncbi:MAG: 30S ribosomal protein S12 methylthiotransferase RimO [Ruminiclostridium sp.]|nr:30S ribosomal protein S12 methylthiotransferase RimO [Ruminiclostridium sp.]